VADKDERCAGAARSTPEGECGGIERFIDLDIKLAYQERLIRDLDALVRVFAARLEKTERDLEQLKRGSVAPTVNEPPPHY